MSRAFPSEILFKPVKKQNNKVKEINIFLIKMQLYITTNLECYRYSVAFWRPNTDKRDA
jgi:hypothetical protein